MDVVRHPGISSTRSDLVKGLRQGRRLVELRRAGLRDERGIPAVLRARSNEDLREDCRGQVQVLTSFRRRIEGHTEEHFASGSDKKIRQYEGG